MTKSQFNRLSFTTRQIIVTMIKCRLKTRELTWAEVAKATGLKENYLKIYGVKPGMSFPLMTMLCGVLDIDLDFIISVNWDE